MHCKCSQLWCTVWFNNKKLYNITVSLSAKLVYTVSKHVQTFSHIVFSTFKFSDNKWHKETPTDTWDCQAWVFTLHKRHQINHMNILVPGGLKTALIADCKAVVGGPAGPAMAWPLFCHQNFFLIFFATRGEIFSLKFTKYRSEAGLRPDPLGELKRSPRPPSRNKGAYF